jgi:glycosyltransferase involved in cell wall biosynthesis
MKICLISVEIFAWGKFGGFGRSTRVLGRELSRRGISVCAVVPRRQGQRAVELLDGMTVYGYPMAWPFAMTGALRACGADIYHSQHPSFGTALALRAAPHKRHIVTFRDPKDRLDWWQEITNPSRGIFRVTLNWAYEDGPWVRHAVRRLDDRFCTAECLNPKLQRIYGFTAPLEPLPTPIAIPERVEKSPTPLVAFVGRLDRRKRPERFFQLAADFPGVQFVAVGRAQDAAWGKRLRSTYGHLPNLRMLGFIDQFQSDALSELLARSWILVNTSVREGLPTSFLEAMAHRCALLSHVNPDEVASRFGYHAADHDFSQGLGWLLEGDRWRERGEAGHGYVSENFELDRVVERHIAIYERLTSRPEAEAHAGR